MSGAGAGGAGEEQREAGTGGAVGGADSGGAGAASAGGHERIEPHGWCPPVGYANGMAATGRLLFVAGQVGWNAATCEFEATDMAGQAAQALRNVAEVLRTGGAEPSHVTRLTWYVTDRDAYAAARPEIGRAYREVFGRHYPPMTLVVVAGLFEPGALLEIEATAVVD